MEFTHISRIKPNDKNGMTKYIIVSVMKLSMVSGKYLLLIQPVVEEISTSITKSLVWTVGKQ